MGSKSELVNLITEQGFNNRTLAGEFRKRKSLQLQHKRPWISWSLFLLTAWLISRDLSTIWNFLENKSIHNHSAESEDWMVSE